MEKIFDVMDCNDAFKTRLAVYKFEGDALAWWKAYKQAKGGDAPAGTEKEQAKENFRWGLHKSILDDVMCIQFMDVAQVADAARNLEILRDRDDYDRSERSDKRHKSGDRYQVVTGVTVRVMTDRKMTVKGLTGRAVVDMNLTSRHGNRNSGTGRDQRNRGSQQSRVPSEGYTHPVCNTCGRRHLGECRRAAGTCFKCGQAGHLQRDCKKNTGASSSGHADKKPDASGRVFALTQDQAANTSGTITGALFIFGRAVFVLFDTGATHSVISTKFASCFTMTPILLDHVLCISTPMKDSARITHVYRDLPLQFDDKIRSVNALPLDMCEFDIILGIDWLAAHRATIDCHSRRVLFGDIRTPKFIYHGTYFRKNFKEYLLFAMLSLTCELIPEVSTLKSFLYRMAPIVMVKDVEGSVTGIVGAKVLFAECIAMGFARSVCQEEGRKELLWTPAKVEAITTMDKTGGLGMEEKVRSLLWNEEREKSFEELKQRLVSSPILTLPSGSGGFQIYSDASKKGLGKSGMIAGIKVDRRDYCDLSVLDYRLGVVDRMNFVSADEFRVDVREFLWQVMAISKFSRFLRIIKVRLGPPIDLITPVIPHEDNYHSHPNMPHLQNYTPASPDYSPASDSESDPSEDPSSDHIPPVPATSPLLSSDDDPTDSDTPDTPSYSTHDTPSPRTLYFPIPHGRPYRYHLNGPVHMMTARKRVRPLPTHRLAERHPTDHSSSDSSSEASSDFHSDASSDPYSRTHLSDHSSPDLPGTSAGLSRKRRRSPMTSVPALSPVSGALSPVRADLIPSPKRVRDSGYLAEVEVDPRETSLRDDVIVRVSDEPHLEQDSDPESRCERLRWRSELRGVTLSVMPEDIPEPAQEGSVEVTYETLGDLVQRFHDHTQAIPDHRIQAIEGVQREQGHRIVGVESAVIALTERLAELERDNRRLRGTMSELEARESRQDLEPQNENGDVTRGVNGGNGNDNGGNGWKRRTMEHGMEMERKRGNVKWKWKINGNLV
ncbi:putative reverse transcriptase domain-containing protein [Tanacetum coccineum]